jgi:uncharacterized protein (DUF1330 family)
MWRKVLAAMGMAAVIAGHAGAETAKPAPAYLVVIGQVSDRDKLMAYTRTLPPIYAANGGTYLGIGGPGRGVTCVAGVCEGRSAIIARFPSSEKLLGFWWGDDYRRAVRLRDGAGVFTVGAALGDADAPFDPPQGALLLLKMQADKPGKVDLHISAVATAVRKAGGRVVSADNRLSPLEGEQLLDRVLLLSFESRAARDAYLAGKDEKKLAKARDKLGLFQLFAIDAPQPPPPPK